MKMKRMGSLVAMAAIAVVGATDVAAQQGRRGSADGPGMRGNRNGAGPGIERILSLRENLELTDGQIAELDDIRKQSVSQRTGMQSRMTELRSELEAGNIKRSELMAAMEDFREAGQEVSSQHRARVEEILTEDQVAKLGELRQDGRRGVRRGGDQARRGDRRGGQNGGPPGRGDRGRRGGGRPIR